VSSALSSGFRFIGFVLGTVEVEFPDRIQFEKLFVSGIRIGLMQHAVLRKIAVVQC
jgi:hypothetical protein